MKEPQWQSTNWNTSGSTATRRAQSPRQNSIKDFDSFPTLEQLPNWGFDGSSTRQAEGHSSDCVLKPVASYPDTPQERRDRPVRGHACRRLTPHSTNARATILDDPGTWFGFEQEYFLYKDGRPLGFPDGRLSQRPPGQVLHAASATDTWATSPARSSTSISTSASTPASTTKASTPKWPRASGNSRSSAKAPRRPPTKCGSPATCCMRLCEKYGVDVNYHCKPLGDTDWNGSGMHSNFSTEVSARSRRQGVLRGADGRLRQVQETSTSPSTARTTTCA